MGSKATRDAAPAGRSPRAQRLRPVPDERALERMRVWYRQAALTHEARQLATLSLPRSDLGRICRSSAKAMIIGCPQRPQASFSAAQGLFLGERLQRAT